jgi:hypothetical protein
VFSRSEKVAEPKREHGVEFWDTGEDNMLDMLLPELEKLAKEYKKNKKPKVDVREMRMAGLSARRTRDYEWTEDAHPRHPAGSQEGGQFAPKDGVSSRVTEGSKGERTPAHKVLEDAARNWIREKTEGREPTRKDIADMAKHLGQQYSAEIDEAIKEFDDYGRYPDRPAVHLVVGEKGVPDVWLLGWRQNEQGLEATPIHDHGPSEAGVYVYKGAVNERIFAINKAEIGQDQIEFRMVDRGLDQGGAITITAPYLHDIGAQKGAGTSVTIHAYYPPLNDMNFYEIRGSKLVKSGSWKESPEAMRKKGFFERSHVFPCYHYSTKKYHNPLVTTHVAEMRPYHTPGGEEHNQDDHGNWADGNPPEDAPFEEGGESTNPKDVAARMREEKPAPKKSGLFGGKNEATVGVALLKRELKFPYTNLYISTLGGEHRPSVMITVSLDDKAKWQNGILENSRHGKFHLRYDGTLEMISGYGIDKLRKSKVKSVEDVYKKINKLMK